MLILFILHRVYICLLLCSHLCMLKSKCYFAKYCIEMLDRKCCFSYCDLILQDRLPEARVVYCSATGASEPRNMGYMVRLGLWGEGTSFSEFREFLGSILLSSLVFPFLFHVSDLIHNMFLDSMIFLIRLKYLLLQCFESNYSPSVDDVFFSWTYCCLFFNLFFLPVYSLKEFMNILIDR